MTHALDTNSVQAPSRGCDRLLKLLLFFPGPVWGCDRLVIRAKVIENQIMAASTIAISSDSSNESVGSPPSRVILFGDIPTVIPSTSVVAPETSTIAPLTALPETRRRPAILIRHEEDIPFARRLAWRHASPRSSDHHSSSSSSSSDSSPVHSSSLDAPDQAHSGSSTKDVPPRLCYPPRRAPRRSEAFRHWCAAPLSTLYPPTTLESSSGDSSERPSSSDSDWTISQEIFLYSSEASIEEDTEIDPIEIEVDMELGISDGDDVGDHVEIDPKDDTEEYEADTSAGDTVEVGIDPMFAPIVEEEIVEPAGEDSSDLSGTRDGIVRSLEEMPIDLNDVVRDFYHHMSEVRIDRIIGIETAQRRLEAD
ncbi:hypothetical protein Tco_1223131 [Tanacetum coccineum]